MNTQTFTLLVILAIVVLFIWRVVSGSRRKQEVEMEERESPQECRKERYAPETKSIMSLKTGMSSTFRSGLTAGLKGSRSAV